MSNKSILDILRPTEKLKFIYGNSGFKLASEELTAGTNISEENEIEIYAKIGNFDGLHKANVTEKQIQITAKLGLNDNYCRVRKSTINGKDTYTYTFKVKNRSEIDSIASRHEYTITLNDDEEFFNSFKLIADKLQTKTRYIFNSDKITINYSDHDENKVIEIPDIKYEVDVYEKPNGELSEWCKIDIEIDKIMQFIDHNYPDLKDIKLRISISHLPFEPIQSFMKDDSNPEIMSRIHDLFEHEFSTDLVALRKSLIKE